MAIICSFCNQCINQQGKLCHRKYAGQGSLWKHLRDTGNDLWQLPAAAPPALPPIQEVPSVSATPAPSRPSTPTTPPHSPRPMSVVPSPSGSNSSRMSVDPPALPELYDVAEGTLATWGLLINRRLQALVCMTCQVVVLPSHLPRHFHTNHKEAKINFSQEELDEIVGQENILPNWPAIPSARQVEYEGLRRVWGYHCPSCPAAYQGIKAIMAHLKEHQLTLSAKEVPRAWVQQLSHSPEAKSSFLVTPRSAQLLSPSADYLLAMRKELDTRPPLPASDLDHRHISPWHVTTRWVQYLDEKDPKVMLGQIEVPRAEEPLFPLLAAVHGYLEAAYRLIPRTGEVCLQILNTETVTDDYNHHPFGQHQLDGTLRAYMRLVIQLLCFVLRVEEELSLPAEVAALVAALRQELSEDGLGVESAIHQLLLALWMREWTPSEGNLFPDPTVRFVIHTQVRADGSLKKPEEVTGVFAKLVYNMGLESTFHTLKSLQHRASSIVMSSQNEPNMVWKDKTGFTTLIYLGHEVSLEALRKCQEDPPPRPLFNIDIAALKDDMGNKQAGYSLFTDRVNSDTLGPVDQLAGHILPPQRCTSASSCRDELRCAWSYHGAYSHATSNTSGGMLRALRIIDGHVVLMRTYHKMRAASGLDRSSPTPSMLPLRDAKVKSLYQDYLFVNFDKPFVGDDISGEMRRWTGKHLGVELGIQKWRQCSTPLRRKHAGLEEMWLEDQDTVDSAQAGHSHRVDTLRYGVTDMSATGMAEDYIGPFLKTSVLWHKVLHLVPGGELLPLESAVRSKFQPAPERLPAAPQQGIDLQAVVEAVKNQLEPRLAAIERRIEETASATKQELRGMFSELKDFLGGPRAPVPAPAVPQEPVVAPERPQSPGSLTSITEDPTEGMYYDPHPLLSLLSLLLLPWLPLSLLLLLWYAEWSNEGQKLAVMSGLEWKKDVVVILPTGSGKSAVVATIAKLEKLKFSYEIFSPLTGTISGQAPILLVSLDSITSASWQQAVASMRPEVTLNRYVIDEAHMILTEASYRDIMTRVKELRFIPAQLMLLSATIPPKSLPDLRKEANLTAGSNTRLRCHLQGHSVAMAGLMPEDRVLVFVQTLANGQQMAKALQEAMVERWYSGVQKTMVATDAFGPGNDYPHVRYVYFVGSPRGVVDMLQMAGRGGRDGNVAHIVFYHLSGQGFPSSPADKHVGRPELQILHRRPTARCWRECWAHPSPHSSLSLVQVTGNISIPISPLFLQPDFSLLSRSLLLKLSWAVVQHSLMLPGMPSGTGKTGMRSWSLGAAGHSGSRHSQWPLRVVPPVYWGGGPTHAGGIIRCPSMLKLLQDTEGEDFRQGGQYLDWKRNWMVYWAYMNRDMRAKMMSKFHVQWVTDLDYVRWLGAKGKKAAFTNVMEVFMWVVETKFPGSYVV
ncbi:hypothetical protein C2E23DRAFT_860305 [Lenzites betulinus]|nr:hypothetical protein C2E23DRAFT_860305 [Lenzites betulinus]